MHVTGRWPIAPPLYESADGLGAGAPAAVEAPPADSSGEGSLSDHEASYSPEARVEPAADDDAPADDRAADGRFAKRHRAASQRADADDVPAISEHTKRIKEIEASLGADIARKDGESERVYNLRRRRELLERQSTAPVAAPTPTAPPQPAPRQIPQQSQAIQPSFPTSEQFFTAYPDATWEDYTDARSDWRYELRAQQAREQAAAESAQRTAQERSAKYTAALPAVKQKYPDFDAVVTVPNPYASPTLTQAIMASAHGPDIAYLLAKDPELLAELNADTIEFHASAIAPMRRYLDSLVAGQRSPTPSTRTAAGPTGAALALAPPPAPRPPTPVRTGTIAVPDTPPTDDDMSLSAHERAFLPKRRA